MKQIFLQVPPQAYVLHEIFIIQNDQTLVVSYLGMPAFCAKSMAPLPQRPNAPMIITRGQHSWSPRKKDFKIYFYL